MCINFNYYLLFILHAFTCTVTTVAYFIFIISMTGEKNFYPQIARSSKSTVIPVSGRNLCYVSLVVWL